MTKLAEKKKLGVVVNPIAGMGGRVGLKGTDGTDILQRAIELGAEKQSPKRATEALEMLRPIQDELQVITPPAEMGEAETRSAGFQPEVVGTIGSENTTAEDTISACTEFLKREVDLILFAGGDGTARDVFKVVGTDTPVLGIPTGVKIHSSVFAINPKRAGKLALLYLQGDAILREGEVMDIDEEAFRSDRVSARLYGYMQTPYRKRLVQPSKSGTPAIPDERQKQKDIAEYLVEKMDSGMYFLGPGSTVKAVADVLNIKKTLLGVDVVKDGRVIHKDANEDDLLGFLRENKASIVVTPIGGQGFVFGRGNQQFSPEVIRNVGRSGIIILATPGKLASIGLGTPLRVDTGSSEVDALLSGYIRVITGYAEEAMVELRP